MKLNNLFNSAIVWHELELVKPIKHDKVIAHIRAESVLSAHFGFMVILSSSIAMLGLLLSSPAVIIGAMLISPLMGPIMSLGFSLSVLDVEQMKQALSSLFAGITLAIAISFAIVFVSPLTEVTAEILARTQPNLFDLLVAIFSGLAGGYAVIKHKGEAIVGVAIATALMPPLSVVGFGLATNDPEIYKGALMLFMTNLLAIAFIVTFLAKWYGFGIEHSPKHTAWQALLIFGVFGALSLPLGLSLKNIANQTYINKMAKLAIITVFDTASKLSLFTTNFSDQRQIAIEAVILTPNYNAQAHDIIKADLESRTHKTIQLKLDQIIIAKEQLKQAQVIVNPDQNTPSAPIQAKLALLSRFDEMNNALQQAVFFPVRFIQSNPETNQASIYPQNVSSLSLTLLRQFEASLAAKFPNWHILVIPPVQALPTIYFPRGKIVPAPESEEDLANSLWALSRWETKTAIVMGHVPTLKAYKQFNTNSPAYQRAAYVINKLNLAGISATPKVNYQNIQQKTVQSTFDSKNFHSVDILFAPQTDTTSNPKPPGIPPSANHQEPLIAILPAALSKPVNAVNSKVVAHSLRVISSN